MGYCIVPPIVPDSLRPLTISSEALESIVTYVNDISKKIDNESSTKDALQALHLVKLLLLQRVQNNQSGLSSLSGALRQKLSFALKRLSALSVGAENDEEGE